MYVHRPDEFGHAGPKSSIGSANVFIEKTKLCQAECDRLRGRGMRSILNFSALFWTILAQAACVAGDIADGRVSKIEQTTIADVG